MSQQSAVPPQPDRSPRTPAEHKTLADVRSAGESFALHYPTLWGADDEFYSAAVAYMRPGAGSLLANAPRPRRASIAVPFWIAWALGILFIVIWVIAAGLMPRQYCTAGGLIVLNVVVAVSWMATMIAWLSNRETARREQLQWLSHEGVAAAWATRANMQAKARSHTPGVAGRQRGPAPSPQPYGVSHEGAEQLVAQWMRHLGETDSEVTRFSGDGGIDVHSRHYIAQVKNYTGSVGVAEIRELAGVAAVDGRKPLFFTSGTYAAGAAEFAERAGIALFRYDAMAGSLTPSDAIAQRALSSGL